MPPIVVGHRSVRADGTRVSVHALFTTTSALDVTVVEFDKAVCP